MRPVAFGWSLFAVALALRVGAVVAVGELPSIRGYECEQISHNLIAGHGYAMAYFGPVAPTAHQYPLYCWLMALHFALFGASYLPLQLTQALVGALSCVVLWRLARRLVDEPVGRVAGLTAALYPVYVYWTVRMQALTLEVLLLILVVWLFDRAFEDGRFSLFAVAGGVFGAACLSKALYLAYLPVILVWAARRWGRSSRWALRPLGVAFLVTALVIAPWTLRNWAVFGAPVLISSNSGWNLYAGNNPRATGSSYASYGKTMQSTLSAETVQALRALDDVEKDALFRREALAWMRDNPGEFAALIPRKLRALWWFDPETPTSFGGVRVGVYLGLLILTALG
ncbi:MAG: glycosyltransferase family 39 protein, partial [Myxococcota bacterium]